MKIEKLLTNISDDDIKDGVLMIPDGVTMLLDVDGYVANVWFPQMTIQTVIRSQRKVL